MTEHDLGRLADLHQRCLPGSLLSGLGPRLLRRYYGWVADPADLRERLHVERVETRIVGAAVLTLERSTLLTRFAAARPLALGSALGGGLLRRRAVRRGLAQFARDAVRGEVDPLAGLPEIVQIYADATEQGQGIGTRLLEQVEDRLRAEGRLAYSVRTQRADNKATLAFYERRGFVARGEITESGQVYVRLERRLVAEGGDSAGR